MPEQTQSLSWKLKTTLLLASSLTVMSGATIAPSLPLMANVFGEVPNAEFLTKLILTIPALFIAISSPFAGKIIDRFGRIRLLLFSCILYALAGTSGFYLNDLYLILVGRAFLGIAVAGIMNTATTLIGDYFEGEERNRFLGFQSSFMAMGGVVFISSGGAMADLSWRYPFLIYIFSIVVLLMTIFFLFEPEIEKKPVDGNERNQKVRFSPLMWLVYGVIFLGMLLFYMVPVQLPFLMKEIGIESNTLTGLVISTLTLFGAITSLNYARMKRYFHFAAIYIWIFFLFGLGFILIFLSHSLPMLVLAMVISGLGAGALFPNTSLWLLQLAPAEARGRIIGGMSMAVFLGQFFSPILVQPIVDLTSLRISYLIGGVFMFLMVVVFALGQKKIRGF